MGAEEEKEKKAILAAGVVIGVVGTFAAILTAAWDQTVDKAKQGDGN